MPIFNKGNLNNSDFHLPYNPQLLSRAKQLGQNPTPAEKKLWQDYLRTFRFRVLRQRPINHFIVDFYCAALKLVIEIDGESHFTQDGQVYDQQRTEILEGYGLSVLRFTNDAVFNNFEGVCQKIEYIIPSTPLQKQGCFIRQGMYFVKTIGDKYLGFSHELLTKLKPNIECLAYFSSPEPLIFKGF